MRIMERIRGLVGFNKDGEEIPDPRPVRAEIPFEEPLPLELRIAKLLRSREWNDAVAKQGMETFEEADDFEIPSDDTFDRGTPYEDDFEPELPGVIARHQEIKHGFVQERPKEHIERARKTLEDFAKAKLTSKQEKTITEDPKK